MTQTRTLLVIAWILVGYLLWDAWQQDYVRAPAAAETASPAGTAPAAVPGAAPSSTDPGAIPDADALPDSAAAPAGEAPRAAAASVGPGVEVLTDVLRVELSADGGTLRRSALRLHRQSTEPDAPPVELLDTHPERLFLAQTGLISASDQAPSHEAAFRADARRYALAEGEDALEVPFEWRGDNGVVVRRIYRFERASYAIGVRYEIQNTGNAPWQAASYRQLQRVVPPLPSRSMFSSPETFSFTGSAWYSPQDKFNKLAFDDFAGEPLDRTITGGWTAMLQHYFLAAWVAPDQQPSRITTEVLNGAGSPRYLIRDIGSALRVEPGASASQVATLFVGPKQQDQLAATAPGLDLSVDYGIFTIIAEPLFWLLDWLHALFGNWGWAIIGLVVLLKLAFFKLSEAQYKSFAKMRRVQPRIEALKERYGDDRQKFQTAMMELYKKEKINPVGGCLPILAQIPVFIALYWVLVESVELRHAPWFGWIQNLNARDPYFILPVLNIVAMYLTQRLSPMVGMDPVQKKMMQAMPLVFGVMFAFFPAGLVLYWATNGWLSLLQQWFIMRRHAEPAKR